MIPRIYTYGAQCLRVHLAAKSCKNGCRITVIRPLCSKNPPPPPLQKLLEPAKLGVNTKAGKIVVTSTGDSLIIEKEKPAKDALQIVQIEAEEPPRDVSEKLISSVMD